MNYSITANGKTENVSVNAYKITGLECNTNYSVTVTAINSCGQESQPANATVFIYKGLNLCFIAVSPSPSSSIPMGM